jgi:hypothetical protein
MQGATMVAATVVAELALLVKISKDLYDAAAVSRIAVAGLSSALEVAGYNAEALVPEMQALATEMQQMSGISDEEIINLEKSLLLRGRSVEEIKKLIPLMVNMSAAGWDLNSAEQELNKILMGQQSRLEMQIDGLRDLRESGASAADQIELLSERFDGQAEAMSRANNNANQLKENWGDIKEILGEIINDFVAPLIAELNVAIEKIKRFMTFIIGAAGSETAAALHNAAIEAERLRNNMDFEHWVDPQNNLNQQIKISRRELMKLAEQWGITEERMLTYWDNGWFEVSRFGREIEMSADKLDELQTSEQAVTQTIEGQRRATEGATGAIAEQRTLLDDLLEKQRAGVVLSEEEIRLAYEYILNQHARRAAGIEINNESEKFVKLIDETNQHLQTTTEELEKQKSFLQNFGEAFGNSLGGSLGQIGEATEVLNSGTASAAEMDAATMSAVGGWIAIADEVSKVAKEIYDIGTSTGDWGEAFETAIIDTLSQIPIIGAWLAEIVDNLWKTGTETLEELQAQEQMLEAAGASTVANKQAQIEILKEQLSKVTDVTKQYEIQADILNLQKKYAEAIKKEMQAAAGMYASAGDYFSGLGDEAGAISSYAQQIKKLQGYIASLNDDLSGMYGATVASEAWDELYNTLSQIDDLESKIEDARQLNERERLAYLETEQTYLEAAGLSETENIENQIAAINEILKTETDEQEILELKTQALELQKELTEDRNDLLDAQIDKIKELAGYVDVENVIAAQTIESSLRSSGLSGTDLNDALTELGITGSGVGDTISSSTIGTQIVNYYVTTTADSVSID